MACINPDGTLTPTAQALIAALHTPCSEVELARITNMPVYRVRSTVRGLVESGFVSETEGKYRLTDSGLNQASQKPGITPISG